MSKSPITQSSVHPLVLLSIVDHFNRVNLKQRNKRVVGALLGTSLLTKVMPMMKMSKLSTVMPFLSKKIPVNQVFGSSTIFITNKCSTWWERYILKLFRLVKRKSSLDGTPPETHSKPMMFKSTKFSENTLINPSSWWSMSSTAYFLHDSEWTWTSHTVLHNSRRSKP